ncbi:MAG: hypothetical protein ACRYE8_03830 [Janthinobacterium lividum]
MDLYFNENVLSKHEITEIQKSKAKAKVSHNNNKDPILESKTSYLVTRGIVTEYITTDGTEVKNMQGKAEPLDRVVYYACFPKLNSGTVDFAAYCNSDGSIKDSVGLKQKFKDIIAMQIKVAEKHKEALDIVTPNAFFAGLNNKDDGKKLFMEAIEETAKSLNVSKDFKGLFIHGHSFSDQEDFKFPIRENNGDAGAPAKIAKNLGYNFTVATCVMGEALGAAGNGAFGKYGNQAMEEDLTRRSFGGVAWIFGPQFNPVLLDATKYKDISGELPTVQSIAGLISNISLNDGKAQKVEYYKDALQFTFATSQDAQKFHVAFPNMTQIGKTQNKNVYIKHSHNKSVGEFEYKGYTYINLGALSDDKANEMLKYLPNGYSTKVTAQNTLSIGKTADLKKSWQPKASTSRGG